MLAGVALSTCWAFACGSFGSPVDRAGGSPKLDGSDDGEVEASASTTESGLPPVKGRAVDLAVGAPLPRDLVVDSANVYWICETQGDAGGIWRVSKTPDAGPATMIVDSSKTWSDETTLVALAADPTAIYWTVGPKGTRLAKGGGQEDVLWLGQSGGDGICQGLAVEPGTIYATTTGAGRGIVQNGSEGPSSSMFSLGPDLPTDLKVLTVDGTDIYAGRPNQIVKISRGGVPTGAGAVFATTTGAVTAIANDDTTVYWADATRVRSLAKKNVGGTPTDLATDQRSPSAIALDRDDVYWANAVDGLIGSVPKSGGAITTLSTMEGQPMAIAVDQAGLFWTNYADGRVRVIWR